MSDPLEPFAVVMKTARNLLGGRAASTIYDMVGRGELDAVKDGKRILITMASIRRRQEGLPRAKIGPPRYKPKQDPHNRGN